MKKTIAVFLCLLLGVALLAGCGTKKTEPANTSAAQVPTDKIKFRLGYLPAVGHVLNFVAKEKGFFEQEGLDVEMFQFTNSGEGLNAIKSGKLDAGAFGTAAPQTFIAKGTPFVVIAGMQSEGHAVIAKPENVDQYNTIQGFVGKKVATVRMATGDAVWRYALTQAGIDWKTQVTIQELDSPAAVIEAVKKGTADAGLVWVPFSEMSKQQGLAIAQWSSEYMNGHVCCRVVALQDNLNNNKEAFTRYARAIIRGYDFYLTNKAETVEVISKYVKIDPKLIEDATYSGHIHSIPDPDKKRFVEFWQAMKGAGYIQSDLDINKFVNSDIYKDALLQLRARYPQNGTYIQLEQDFAKNNQ